MHVKLLFIEVIVRDPQAAPNPETLRRTAGLRA
jgi:hypothetical protein